MGNALIALSALALALATPQTRTIGAAEGGLRQMALSSVMPSYPASSLAAGTSGVAVAAILTSTTAGGAPTVEILEAPDPAIADAVRAALAKWTFAVFQYPMQGKLTFYFRIEQGKGRVVNPQDLPGGPVVRPRPTYTPENPPPVASSSVSSNVFVLKEENTTPITFEELQKLTGANRPTILDVGERSAFKRGHLDGAVNIPYDEVAVRAPIELRGVARIVIDCTREENRACLSADHSLKLGGFKDVAILRR